MALSCSSNEDGPNAKKAKTNDGEASFRIASLSEGNVITVSILGKDSTIEEVGLATVLKVSFLDEASKYQELDDWPMFRPYPMTCLVIFSMCGKCDDWKSIIDY